MATVDDNNFDIPYLTGNDTFLDWVNHYNNYTIEKLNNIRIFDGVSGDSIGLTLGTTADGTTWGGVFRVDLNDEITKGLTFSDSISIRGNLDVDGIITANGMGTRFGHSAGLTGISGGAGGSADMGGYLFGQPVRLESLAGGTHGYGITLAQASGVTGAEVFGVVTGITWPSSSGTPYGPYTTTNTYVEVATSGIVQGDFTHVNVTGFGLSAGEVYFLSPGVTGGLTTTEPVVSGQVSKPVLLGITADKGLVLNYRGQYLQGTGTGGTGGIDNNRFIVLVDNTVTFESGHVVGYDKNADVGGAYGWFICNEDNIDSIDKAVGVCTKANFDLDGSKYIEVVNTGWVDSFPSNGNYGVLYIGSDGKLTSNVTGSLDKVFAIAWDEGGTTRGLIMNRLAQKGDSMGGAKSSAPMGGEVGAWAARSSTAGGVTFGSAINPNMLINGGFDVWQRDIGKREPYGTTGSTYFADRWVRNDGISYGTGSSYGSTWNIERQTFDTNQTEVYGQPKYYCSFKNDISSGTTLDYVHIENRIEDVRTARNETVTLSFWSKCGVTGSTMDVAVTQWDGNTASTTYPSAVSLGTLWNKYEVAFQVPNITTTPTGKHYLGIGFRTEKLSGTTLDLAKVKLERGLVATNNPWTDEDEEHNRCKRFYQRSYNMDDLTHWTTMLDSNTPALSVVDFTITPEKDFFYNFPVPMRDTPSITFYSPGSGYTGDVYNRTAQKDLRNTSGTSGWNGTQRIAGAGATTISADYYDKYGMYISIPAGAVLFDNISLHYLADAELDDNMVWRRPS